MKAINGIKSSLGKNDKKREIARKIYLSYPTHVFVDSEDDEFEIKNSIAIRFNVPFSSIQIVGSSKTGISLIKSSLFKAGKSDLDIAIISLPLFNKIMEMSYEISSGYTDNTKFPIYRRYCTDKQFKNGLLKGFINPFFMPNCEFKTKWLEFFNLLSNRFELFKNINAGIYASETFFEFKQEECINQYQTNPEHYDKISSQI